MDVGIRCVASQDHSVCQVATGCMARLSRVAVSDTVGEPYQAPTVVTVMTGLIANAQLPFLNGQIIPLVVNALTGKRRTSGYQVSLQIMSRMRAAPGCRWCYTKCVLCLTRWRRCSPPAPWI